MRFEKFAQSCKKQILASCLYLNRRNENLPQRLERIFLTSNFLPLISDRIFFQRRVGEARGLVGEWEEWREVS